jgi:mannose-6-phosphate isomerase-like protein (cupin superfamily)
MRTTKFVILLGVMISIGCAPPSSDVEDATVEAEPEQAKATGIRRIVTGHDSNGKAVFASDDRVEPITLALLPGTEFYRIWGADALPDFPDDGSAPSHHAYFPPVGGFRFGLFTVAPDSISKIDNLDTEAAFREIEEKLPGVAKHLEPDHPGMHTTASIDYEYVVSGRCVLELDDGETRELGPGDTVVQNGTRHAWRNPFDEPCVMVVVLIGAPNEKVVIVDN